MYEQASWHQAEKAVSLFMNTNYEYGNSYEKLPLRFALSTSHCVNLNPKEEISVLSCDVSGTKVAT